MISRYNRGDPPRLPTSDDVDNWFASADNRRPPSSKTRKELQTLLKRKNPVRYFRMKSDLRWAQRILKREGRNPEDARFVI